MRIQLTLDRHAAQRSVNGFSGDVSCDLGPWGPQRHLSETGRSLPWKKRTSSEASKCSHKESSHEFFLTRNSWQVAIPKEICRRHLTRMLKHLNPGAGPSLSPPYAAVNPPLCPFLRCIWMQMQVCPCRRPLLTK